LSAKLPPGTTSETLPQPTLFTYPFSAIVSSEHVLKQKFKPNYAQKNALFLLKIAERVPPRPRSSPMTNSWLRACREFYSWAGGHWCCL